MALKLASINVTQFTAHSYRGAGLSAAHQSGASIKSKVKHGDWRNISTFKKYYVAPSQDSTVGRIIMNHYQPGDCCTMYPQPNYHYSSSECCTMYPQPNFNLYYFLPNASISDI